MSGHRPVHVIGGSGGICANLAELGALALAFGHAHADVEQTRDEVRLTLTGALAHGSLPMSGVDLVTAVQLADVGACVDAALAELWLAGLLCAQIRRGLLHAVRTYLFGERSLAATVERVAHSIVVGEVTLPGGGPVRAGQAALTADIGDYYALLHASGLGLAQEVLQIVAADRDGTAVPTGVDTAGVAGRPPRDLDDLIGDLAQRNDDARHGEIDVRVLTMPDGSRKVVVDITGTKTWGLTDTDVTDLRTNLVAMNGRTTAYERGVLSALRQSGVRASDDVMLIGHSQGGMIAVNAAAHLARSGEFRITHVVTAGAPIGRGVRAVGRGTQVLAIENRTDAVPVLDDRANPDRPTVTTARTDRGDGTILGDHDLRTAYLPAAGDVEASRNQSLRHVLGTMRGYFGATSVTTHTYQVRRT